MNRYLSLVKQGSLLEQNLKGLPEIKIAVVGECEMQAFAPVLKATAHERGYFLKLEIGPFSVLEQLVLDPQSKINLLKPKYVFVMMSTSYLRDLFFSHYDPEIFVQHFKQRWHFIEQLQDKGYQPIIANLTQPLEGCFGNYSILANNFLFQGVSNFNRLLHEKILQQSGALLLDMNYLSSWIGLESWSNEGLWRAYKYPCNPKYFPDLADQLVSVIRTSEGQVTKCVVLDLDNTLWGGILADDGSEGLQLGDGIEGEVFVYLQRYFKVLKERGYLLCLASKNNYETAIEAIKQHPNMVLSVDDFSCMEITLNDKASSIRKIAAQLDISLSSVLFIDDSPHERALVKAMLPDVMIPDLPKDPAAWVSYLERQNYFEALHFSDEDRNRTQQYKQNAVRTELKAQFKNLDEYLQSLKMQINVLSLEGMTLARAVQLMQRSNQFNLRTQRYTESDCQKFSSQPDKFMAFALELKDCVGDSGIIAVLITKVDSTQSRLEILEWVMSCRVLQRQLEDWTLNFLVQNAQTRGLKNIYCQFIPSPKNDLVKDLLNNFGFSHDGFLKVLDFKPRKTTIRLQGESE